MTRRCKDRDDRITREMRQEFEDAKRLPRINPPPRQRVVFRSKSGRTIVRVATDEKQAKRLFQRREARLFVGGQG